MSDSILIKSSQQLAQVVVLGVWAFFVLVLKAFFTRSVLSLWKICFCHWGKHALGVAYVCEQGITYAEATFVISSLSV